MPYIKAVQYLQSFGMVELSIFFKFIIHWQNLGYIFHQAPQEEIRGVSDMKIAVSRKLATSSSEVSLKQLSILERRHLFSGRHVGALRHAEKSTI